MKKIIVISLIIISSLIFAGCVNDNQKGEINEIKSVDKTNNVITPTITPKIIVTQTINPTLNKYKKGDVISAFKNPNQIPYGWVVSRYDTKQDLYYGYKVTFGNGVWKRSENKEWDLWNKMKTEKDFPFLQGHISL